ncbi:MULTISPECIES: recombination directionality factor [Streptomyces]|uniref:recombination directionality factor n=1 Tax=Streptomyces TaxID=1883 RepID=UPI0034428D28
MTTRPWVQQEAVEEELSLPRMPHAAGTSCTEAGQSPLKGIRPSAVSVGRFRAGTVCAGRPVALDTWRVTTSDMNVARCIAACFGGKLKRCGQEGGDMVEVTTTAASVDVVVDRLAAIETRMRIYGSDSVALATSTEGEGWFPLVREGAALSRHTLLARVGQGLRPSILLGFRLTELPDVGQFQLVSAAWSLVEGLHFLIEQLRAEGRPVRARLTLESAKTSGKGSHFSYPVVRFLGPG